jgi:UDP-glucose 6-dehydrogenase
MKIGLIGAGRLGLCLALLIEKAGYDVIASDTRSDYIKELQDKTYNGSEPTVGTLLNYSKNIEFTTDNERVILESDIIFTLVATPSNEDGSYDVSNVEDVVSDFMKLGWKTTGENGSGLTGKSLVVGCTTNPGDCEVFHSFYEY